MIGPRRSTRRGRCRRTLWCAAAVMLTGAIVAGCGSGSPATPATAAQLFSAGMTAQSQRRYALAATDFSTILSQSPDNADAAYDLGVAEGSLGKTAAAISDYTRALSLDPTFTPAMFNLADEEASRDPAAAITMLRKLLALDPNDPSAEFNLGYILESQGHKAAGEAFLVKAIAADPSLRAKVPSGFKLPG